VAEALARRDLPSWAARDRGTSPGAPELEPPSPASQPVTDDPEPAPPSREDRTIARLLEAAHRRRIPLTVPPGDDAAVLADGTAVASDLMVEGVHWDAQLSPEDVGYKLVAVNASDMAATGARPTWMLLDLAVPRGDDAWVEAFARGLGQAAQEFDVDLIGGDTSSVPPGAPRFAALTLAGATPSAGPLRRDAGQPGDLLVVTGTPGLASAGRLSPEPHPQAVIALRRPPSRVGLALALAGTVRCAMDLSDGLLFDLPRLCRASNTGAVVDPTALPDHPALHQARPPSGAPLPPRSLQLAGGDDYELLLAVPQSAWSDVQRIAADHGVPVTVIGVLTAHTPVVLDDGDWPAPPWSHFEDTAEEAT